EMTEGVQESTVIHAATWGPDTTSILITAWSHISILGSDLWSWVGLSGFMPPRDPDTHGLIFSAWSPDSEQVASSVDDGRIFVWSTTTGQILITFEGHSAPVKRLAWNPVSN